MCGCRKGQQAITYDAPSTSTWGPLLWRILHIAAENGKRHTNTFWSRAIEALGDAIPCTECRGHFASYIAAHPFSPPSGGGSVRDYVRTWLLDFHNDVNSRLGKPAFLSSDLQGTYSGVDIAVPINQFMLLMPAFKLAGVLNMYKWDKFISPIRAIMK
jgi:hypothetical protein